jgi:hypothetical protein
LVLAHTLDGAIIQCPIKCYPCLGTPVTYVSGLYTLPEGDHAHSLFFRRIPEDQRATARCADAGEIGVSASCQRPRSLPLKLPGREMIPLYPAI